MSTMKAMLLKDNPSKEWDHLLPLIISVLCKEVLYIVTGYSPFALMFGREVEGPLTLLHRHLLGETPEDLPVWNFIDSLKVKLCMTWEHASDLAKQRSKTCIYHDTKTRQRSFAPGSTAH